MKQKIIYTCLILFPLFFFSQNKDDRIKDNKIGIELCVGKTFSQYRYFKNYNGYENLNLSFSYNFLNRIGLYINQSYGRMFDKSTNTRGIILISGYGIRFSVLQKDNIEVKLNFGSGYEQIYLRCLHDNYPVKSNLYGMPINIGTSFLYSLNNKLALNINLNYNYGFLFYNNNNIIDDPYYYKTLFSSLNFGVRYNLN